MALKRVLVGSVMTVETLLTDPSTGDPDDTATQDRVDDPTLVVTAFKPDGTNATIAVTHISLGLYRGSISIDQAGVWKFASASTGAAAGAGPSDGPAELLVRAVT